MQSPDKKSDAYNRYWGGRKPGMIHFRFSVFAGWIKPGSKVLDVGGGDGTLAAYLRERLNCSVTCLDVSESAVKKAEELGLDAICSDLEKPLPFPDGVFDAVIASEVIEHISHSEELLKEMARVSKGSVLISIPNTAFWKDRLSLLSGSFPKQWVVFPYEHLRFWSLSDFKRTVAGLGFKITEIKAGSGRRWLRDLWPSMFARQICYKINTT